MEIRNSYGLLWRTCSAIHGNSHRSDRMPRSKWVSKKKTDNQLITSAIMAPGSIWHTPISFSALSSAFIAPPNIPARASGLLLSNVLSPDTVDVSGQKVQLATEQPFSLRFSRLTINDIKCAATLLYRSPRMAECRRLLSVCTEANSSGIEYKFG